MGEAAVAVARAELYGALDVLLARARAAGAVRAGIGAAELIALLKGLLQAVREQRGSRAARAAARRRARRPAPAPWVTLGAAS